MCLSNVYKGEVKDENLLARNVADVRVQDGKIILTDLMGIRKEFDASIQKVDLMENYIVIDQHVVKYQNPRMHCAYGDFQVNHLY